MKWHHVSNYQPVSTDGYVFFLLLSGKAHIYNEFLATLYLSGKVKITADSVICHTTYSWMKGEFPHAPTPFFTEVFQNFQHFQQEQRSTKLVKQSMFHETEKLFMNVLYHFKFVLNGRR